MRDVQEAASALGLKIHILPASADAEIDAAFETVAREQINAVEVAADPFLDNHRNKLVALAAVFGGHNVPFSRTSCGRRPDELWD